MRQYLDPTEVAQVVQLLQDGTSICAITRRFAVSPSTVSRAWRRFQETDCYSRTAGQGRRRSLTHQQDWYLLLFTTAAMTTVSDVVDACSELFVVPAIADTMPRDHYQTIMRHLCFHNKDTHTERVKNERFFEISAIWRHFVKNCVLSYNPVQHITVDEQLFPTKFHCPFLQYITTKPEKFGIKFWITADLETKCMCNATPYLGKNPGRLTGERISDTVIIKLKEPFLDKSRIVTTDNFFTKESLYHNVWIFWETQT